MRTPEEIIKQAYESGLRRILCPVCLGGENGETGTMSIQANEVDGLTGKCWRATCNAFIRAATGLEVGIVEKPPFVPNPLREPYQRPALPPDRHYNLRVLTGEPTTRVWKLVALDGTHLGHVTRTADKTIRTFKDVDRPMYYSNGRSAENEALFVFEDPMSAAVCTGEAAIALLGTNISDGLISEIKAAKPWRVFVALDPGAEEAALRVYERLVNAGVSTVFVPMSKDFKDMTLDERNELVAAYA